MGKDPYNRLPEEVMTGMLGAGGWSDGKLTYHTEVGGQLSKYCGEEKAMELMDQVINNFKRFHPKPEAVQCSDPQAEPEFIKSTVIVASSSGSQIPSIFPSTNTGFAISKTGA